MGEKSVVCVKRIEENKYVLLLYFKHFFTKMYGRMEVIYLLIYFLI